MRRRRFIRTSGTAAAGGSMLFAGCSDEQETLPGEEFPAVHEWLTETDVGGADGTYDGALVDRRGESEIRIDVGATGNDGPFAYDASAVVAAPGTTVQWVWVANLEEYSVDADPDRQLGVSDYMFSSGGPVAGDDHEYTQTFDREGVALYHSKGIVGGHNSKIRPPTAEYRAGDISHWNDATSRAAGGDGGSVLHLEPQLYLGMKGGVAVTE